MIRPFSGTFPITQEWGVNPSSYSQFGLKGHNGVDYGTLTGTPIIAPHSGRVIEAAFDQYGYGNYVKIENDQEGSILAHFQSFNVNAGDTVSEGQQVGVSDNTGNSTGPHLHWGYYRKPRNKNDGFSGTCNPYPYLKENNPTTSTVDCSTITAERDRLNGVITGKDELITNLNQQIAQKNATMSTLEVEKKSLADQLSTCQSTSQLHLEQANKAIEYKQQVTHLEEQKAGWITKEQEYIKQIKTLQTKNENLKKPVQKLILALCEKLGVQI